MKKVKYKNDYIFIEFRDERYIAYMDIYAAKLGIPSPSLMRLYSQEKLARAYETGILKSIF